MTLAALLDEAASTAGGVDTRQADGGVEYLVDGRPFAAVTRAMTADVAEFRLDIAVGGAALGTPDTESSPRGPEWIAFRPPDLDRFARDRAVAWFLSAYRRARG